MKTPHKHAELIKLWADGAPIQVRHGIDWSDIDDPMWNDDCYRIKPESKPDFVLGYKVKSIPNSYLTSFQHAPIFTDGNLILIFDGKTGELKSAEMVKPQISE